MTDEPKPQGTAAPISHEEAGHIPTEYPWSLEPGMVYYTSPDRGVAIYAHSGPRPLRNELGPGWTPISPTSMRYLWSVGPHPVREAFGSGGLGAAIGERCVSMGVEWDSIGLYRQGFDPKDAPVTVLIVQQESIIGEPCTDMRTHLEHVAHTVRDDIIAR